ncbi:response regulator [Myxococcota bacterium]|nr:response regulator [Myxococcota bacterium]MCZ7619180.1 response regulator [Myxococcota bacterium]
MPEAHGRRTILVVDDTPLLRELAALFLARAGRVFTAASGEEALTLASVIRPDLVFADVSMPGLGGTELCRLLKRDPRHQGVPVILLTSSDAASERESAIRAGADDVIPKPVERLHLLEAARRLLAESPLRGLPRISIDAPVALRKRRSEWRGTARNLSRGGVFVETDQTLTTRTELDLALDLPETPLALASTAQVIWARPSAPDQAAGMGLRFLGLDRRMARQLMEYVDERVPTQLADREGDR